LGTARWCVRASLLTGGTDERMITEIIRVNKKQVNNILKYFENDSILACLK